MTAEEKIEYIAKQIAAIERQATNTLNCPYCGEQTVFGALLCCMTMGKAVRAILQRDTQQELAQHAERIAESIDAGRN
jgi:hypothetical protein